MAIGPVIVLDTHALVWWVSNPNQLPPAARTHIDHAQEHGETIHASSISAWEIAMLVSRERLQLTMDVSAWVRATEDLPFLRYVGVDNEIAIRAVQLKGYPHRDPADRIIVATAMGLGAVLVTADEGMHAYRHVRTVWERAS